MDRKAELLGTIDIRSLSGSLNDAITALENIRLAVAKSGASDIQMTYAETTIRTRQLPFTYQFYRVTGQLPAGEHRVDSVFEL